MTAYCVNMFYKIFLNEIENVFVIIVLLMGVHIIPVNQVIY